MKDLNLKGVRDDVIFELRAEHGYTRVDANKYWDKFHKGVRGESTMGAFDDWVIGYDPSKDEIKDFLLERGANVTSALAFYVSRALLAKRIKDNMK